MLLAYPGDIVKLFDTEIEKTRHHANDVGTQPNSRVLGASEPTVMLVSSLCTTQEVWHPIARQLTEKIALQLG